MADCSRTSIGLPALEDIGTGLYVGEQCGLYPGGANTPPVAYQQRGIDAGALVTPIRGKIGFLAIGMSNTAQVFDQFINDVSGVPISPVIVMVNGAQGGRGLEDWAIPSNAVWATLDQRIVAAGLKNDQVRAIWWSHGQEQDHGPFPGNALAALASFRAILTLLRARFKNLRQIHLSDVNYLGYVDPSNPKAIYAEPGIGHDNAWAVKWLIADQLNSTTFPWLGWGARHWTDGELGRTDGLVWHCSDSGADGVHPSGASGREKLASRLLDFYLTAPETAWFRV